MLTIRLINHEKGRYYKIMIEKDLLGDHLVIKTWGSLYTRRGNQAKCGFALKEDAYKHLIETWKRKEKRGYK